MATDRFRVEPVGLHQPAQHLEQFPGRQNGLAAPNGVAAVHGLVAEILEQPEAPHLLTRDHPEIGAVDQIGKSAVAEGTPQLPIVVVDPLHQHLDRATGVEAGGAGIRKRALLHSDSLGMEIRPLVGDQGVLGGGCHLRCKPVPLGSIIQEEALRGSKSQASIVVAPPAETRSNPP